MGIFLSAIGLGVVVLLIGLGVERFADFISNQSAKPKRRKR